MERCAAAWRRRVKLVVRSLRDIADLHRLVPQWEELERGLPLKLPFSSPLWLLTWWRHYAQTRPLLSDALYGYAFFNGGGELLGLAPLMVTHRPGRGPLRLRQLQLLGADPNVTELSQVLAHPEHEEMVWQALQETLANDGGWDFARWWVTAGSGAERALRGRQSVEWDLDKPAFLLEPGSTWEAFKSSRPRNVKESLRKCYNSLSRDGRTFLFHAHTSSDAVARALDRVFALHRERARAADTVAHADVFATAQARGFIREVMDRFATRGQARVFELEIGGEIVAGRMGFVIDDTLYLYYSGYLNDWGRYSVMTTVTAEAIRHAIGSGLKTVNLSFGDDVSKTRWRPREVTFLGALQTADTLRAYLGRGAYDVFKNPTATALTSRLSALFRRH
jgi:CelD/BcsL family acetyltransferase involved in cellulose biosynthesis